MAKQNKFGTFGGVFVPSILTILGVIMYLRLPNIVGQAGLLYTIAIIFVAHIISITTGLSVSSIATDKKVEAGGTYYMISRSLGLPIGGTLGLALFIGLSFSVSLYLIGFSESLLPVLGFEASKTKIQIAGTAVLIAVTTVTFISTSLAIKTQYLIMAAIFLSLLSIIFGTHEFAPDTPIVSSWENAEPIIVLFGIFFPAVTGFEAGVSMSGDLKDPKKSIPFGSISAIAVGFVVYIALAFFLSYTVERSLLLDTSKNPLMEISRVPELVLAGIWGATLSSALGSILGAPRILQATAVDRISPRIFSRGAGKSNEPRNALLLTFVIAEAGILIGDLNVIARIVSVFFITTYGFLNLSCAFERWASADFRPQFKTPVWVSLIGSVACLLVMIQLDIAATLGASLLMTLVFLLLKRKELSLQSGDTWSGVWASLVKSGLEYLNSKAIHNRNWRPNILLFLGSPDSRPHLFQLGKDLSGKLGMLTTFQLKISDIETPVISAADVIETKKEENGRYFDLVYSANDPYRGINEISRIYGFSGVRPNTILMGWTKNPDRQEDFGRLISTFNRNNQNSIFLNLNEKRDFGDFHNIDIWWSGYGSNLSFAISIIRFLTSGKHWKDVKIRLFVPIENTLLTERVYTTLERIVNQYRIAIEIKVVDNSIDQLSSYQLIERESSESDLTIVGLPSRRYENMKGFMEEIKKLLPIMGSTLLINASSQFKEYDLALEEKLPDVTEEDSVELATIPQFMYPVVTEEMHRLDNDTSALALKFFEKALLPHFLESMDWIQNLKESIDTTSQNFVRANEIEDHFRRNKAFFKIKNEFYFKITSLFEKKQAYKFTELKHLMEQGIGWYFNELSARIASTTNNYRIEHHVGSFTVFKQDPVALKRFKLFKRLLHPFAKKTIPIFARYKKLSDYYIRSRQILMLDSLLSEFELSSYKFLHTLKQQIQSIDAFIDKSGHEFLGKKLTDLKIEKQKSSLLKTLVSIESEQRNEQKRFQQELLASFRRDIIRMGYDLEEIRVNKLAGSHDNVIKLSRKARKQVLSFPEQWHEKAVLYYNKLDAEVIMTAFKSRVLKLVDDYRSEINVYFYQRMVRNINKLLTQVEDNKNALQKVREIKVDFTGDASIKIFREMNTLTMEVMKLVDSLPREVLLPHEDESKKGSIEPVAVPISKIARHFFESRFVGQVSDRLDKTKDAVSRIIHEINDQVNLTRFSIDNLESEAVIGNKEKDTIIANITALLKEELNEVQTLYNEICQQFETALEEAFDPLASYKIIESAKAFTTQLRDYQSRRIKDILGLRTKALNTAIMKQLAKVWYSKSEGVLLAKKLTEAERYKSQNEKILDIVEAVTPSPSVMNSMPHYYKSLFSGRSNITDEFWVEMKREEAGFKKAIDRYNEGVKGAILVTGERNCGKTNLCQHVLRKHFGSKRVFHVFPPVEGSTNLHTFERELGKVTGISRGKSEIYDSLQFGSVIVFQDLELWWERSAEGLDLLKEIIKDINRYSSSYLFVINTNVFAYELINKVLNLQNHLIGVIKCQSLDSEDLKALLMKRHQSSGLSFVLEGKREEEMTQLNLAKLFSRYFDATMGNPGVALNAWLGNIVRYKNEEIHLKNPSTIDAEILHHLDEEGLATIQQIALHKRMDRAKLMRVLDETEEEVLNRMQPLRINGLIHEKTEGVFVINPFVEPYLMSVLKNKKLL
jgi:amino acid transporter